MVIELIGLSVPYGNGRELTSALASLVGRVQVQRGCLGCRLFRSWPQQDGLQLEARWTSQEDLICHLQSDIYKKILLLIEESAAPPVLEFLTVLECRGLDLVETVRYQDR